MTYQEQLELSYVLGMVKQAAKWDKLMRMDQRHGGLSNASVRRLAASVKGEAIRPGGSLSRGGLPMAQLPFRLGEYTALRNEVGGRPLTGRAAYQESDLIKMLRGHQYGGDPGRKNWRINRDSPVGFDS